jgi:hypothetical protein
MRLKRTALQFLVACSVVFTLLLVAPYHIHRYEFGRAFVAWHKNPSLQNAAVLRKEQDRYRIAGYSITAGFALVTVLAASRGYWALRRAMTSGTDN